MTDSRKPDDGPGDEVLSAYLSGELEESEAAELDERLARDPELAARLDGIADVVATLRRLDAVEPPPGFRERLERRLAAEQEPEVASFQPRPGRRRPRWAGVGVAAAALVAVAVTATGLLQGVGDDSAEEAADAPMARTQEAPEAETFAGEPEAGDAPAAAPDADGAPGAAPDAAEEDLDEDASAPDAPAAEPPTVPDESAGEDADDAGAPPVLVRDEAVELPDEATIRDRYRGLAEAAAILGTPAGETDRLASRARASLEAAGVNPGGVPATACADAAETAVGSPSVIVLVESAVAPQGPALAHVLVSAVGERLDRVEALLLEPASCAPIAHVLVTDGR